VRASIQASQPRVPIATSRQTLGRRLVAGFQTLRLRARASRSGRGLRRQPRCHIIARSRTTETPSRFNFLGILRDAVVSVRDHEHSHPDDRILEPVRSSPALFGVLVPIFGITKRSGHFASPNSNEKLARLSFTACAYPRGNVSKPQPRAGALHETSNGCAPTITVANCRKLNTPRQLCGNPVIQYGKSKLSARNSQGHCICSYAVAFVPLRRRYRKALVSTTDPARFSPWEHARFIPLRGPASRRR
jgi:hypothetical protein